MLQSRSIVFYLEVWEIVKHRIINNSFGHLIVIPNSSLLRSLQDIEFQSTWSENLLISSGGEKLFFIIESPGVFSPVYVLLSNLTFLLKPRWTLLIEMD